MPNYGTKKTGDHWKPGDYYGRCDICGYKKRSSELRATWDHLWVCEEDFEPRHPQDFVRSTPDNQRVPIARPDTGDVFLSDNEVTADDL